MAKPEIDWDDPVSVAAARGDFSDDNPKPGVSDDADDDAAAAAAKAAKDAEDAADADAAKAQADKEAADKTAEDAAKAKAGDDPAAEGAGADAEAAAAAAKAAAEADPDADPDVDSKGVMIPKGRYDSVKGRLNEAEAKIKDFEDAEAAKTKTAADEKAQADSDAAAAKLSADKQGVQDELDDLEKQYMKHLKDGEDDEALALRKQIRAKEREIYHQEAEEVAGKAKSEAMTETKATLDLDATYDYVEENFAVLNPEHEDFDQTLVDEVQELRAGFLATGKYSPTDALLRAVKVLIPEVEAVPGTSEEIDEAAKKAAEDKRAAKKKADVEKALVTAGKQPADMAGAGDDSHKGGKDTPDPKASQMTRTDFDTLPEATKQRMRGDFSIPQE